MECAAELKENEIWWQLAEEALRQKRSMAEYQLAQGNLARALNRLRVSGKV